MSRRRTRSYYLEDIPLAEAERKFEAALTSAGALGPATSESIALDLAHGRVTDGPVWARSSSPHYDASAMDGVAVRSRDTVGATETSPVRLAVGDQAAWVDTGDAMPDGFDAVIKVEVVHEIDDSTIEIRASVPPYHDVRPLGEDIAAAELVVPAGHRLRPQDLAACAQAGLSEVDVRRPPRVAIIPTGSELVPVGTTPEPGGIIESNSLMLAAMIAEWGGDADRRRPVPDDRELLQAAVQAAVQDSDVVVVNAGSSAGSEDYTAQVIRELGELVVHGVAVKPGHPVALGVVGDTPVLGIPGLRGVCRPDHGAVRQADHRTEAGALAPPPRDGQGRDDEEDSLRNGRGRVPAGQAGQGGRPARGDSDTTRRGHSHVPGAC